MVCGPHIYFATQAWHEPNTSSAASISCSALKTTGARRW
jgi:hypothetical protein